MSNLRRNKGSILVTLIITIILLLVIVGITIRELSQNGLLKNSKLSKEKMENYK